MIFKVSSLKKSVQNRCQVAFEKTSKKNNPEIDFGIDFGFPKPPKIAPKSRRDVQKWGLEPNLFRDAMEITRKSSEVNGPHSFWTTNLATHMIRSS